MIEEPDPLIDQKLDDLFNRFETWFQAGRFDLIDEELSNVVIDNFDSALITGYLGTTYAAKHLLKSREAFVKRAEEVLLKKLGVNKTETIMGPLG